MNTSWIQTGTRWFFWCGFGVFLAASIPHVATYFRHFDPVTADASNIFYWLIAYALAIVLDISDVLVSIAVMKAQGEGRRVRDVLPYWFFIAFITAFSWFVNWQYNVVFGTTQFHTVDAYHIGIVSIGQINPIIGSAFQILLLVYTGMAHKFSQHVERTEKSLDDLKQEAKEAVIRATLLKQIHDAHPSPVTRLFSTLRQVKEETTELLSHEQKQGDIPVVSLPENTGDNAVSTQVTTLEDGTEKHTDELDAVVVENAGVFADKNDDTDTNKNTSDQSDSCRATGKLTMTVKEVATRLGLSESYVRELKAKKRLKASTRNTHLITVASVKAYEESRQKHEQPEQQSSAENASETQRENTTHNGHAPRLDMDNLVPLEV